MTVAELRAALAGYPDDMPVAVRTVRELQADPYCTSVADLAVRDIWHEDDGGYDHPADDSPEATPTLIINDVDEVVGL